MSLKVRFAPSPTGLLHIGNARIAVVNSLLAQKINAKFLLRIDDTDFSRSRREYEEEIIKDLEWLGIKHDEFFRQSERLDRYNEVRDNLLASGALYKCYESVEELEYKRKLALSRGKTPVYDRASLNLSQSEIKYHEENRTPYCIRFKLPDATVSWDDLVVGHVSYDLTSISDPIIVKADGSYLYSFCSVVDDIDSEITHIVRGQDHLTNTAAQISMFDHILGCKNSISFAHLSLLVGKDGSQFSKRIGSSSLGDLRRAGVHPMTINNILSTLGTSKNTQTFLAMKDLVEYFDIKSFGTNSPKFDPDMINTINKKILHSMPYDMFVSENKHSNISEQQYNIIHGNVENLTEYDEWSEILSSSYKPCKSGESDIIASLIAEIQQQSNICDFAAAIKNVSTKTGISGKELYVPIRMAITGREHGPNISEICELLGCDEVLRRLTESLN